MGNIRLLGHVIPLRKVLSLCFTEIAVDVLKKQNVFLHFLAPLFYLAVLWDREDVHSLALGIQRGDSPLLDGCLLHTVVEHHRALRVHGAFIQGA